MAITQLPASQVLDDSIKNADIASDAAIAVSKLASSASTIVGTKDTGGVVALTPAEAKTILSLSNVDNTSDSTKNSATVTLSNKTLDESNRAVGSPINVQTGTTYTFVLTDSGKLCTFSNASAITVTVPPNSSVAFPVGAQIDCSQLGAGKVTFAEGAGVTINSESSNKSIGAQYAGVTLRKLATDTWLLVGNLIA